MAACPPIFILVKTTSGVLTSANTSAASRVLVFSWLLWWLLLFIVLAVVPWKPHLKSSCVVPDTLRTNSKDEKNRF